MKQSKLFRGLAIVAALVVAIFAQGDAQAAVAGRISSTLALSFSTAQDFGTAVWNFGSDGTVGVALTDGSTVNKANKIHIDTIATGTSYDLDAGTLVNPLGVAQAAFSRIVSIRVCAPAANTVAVALSGDFLLTKYLGGWADDAITIPVHPGGCFLFLAPSATGVAVTATTGDVLTVTPDGTETAYVAIVGS